jgi:HEAT repeat protein
MNATRQNTPTALKQPGGWIRLIAILLCLGGCSPGPADWLADLKSTDVPTRRSAAEKLAEKAPTSPEVVAALTQATDDSDPEVRRWSCRGLGRHNAAASVKQLESKLRDPATAVRRAAAFSLQTLAPESTGYREEFIAGMRMGDGGLLVAIKGFEPPATWSVPVLLELMKDRRPGIRRLAVEAIGEIAPAMVEPRKALEAARRDPDDRVREAAAKALAGKT